MAFNRRRALRALLGVGAGLGLRSMATGLPLSMLMNPARALAEQSFKDALPLTPQFLILSTSYMGDPLNANVPGSYLDSRIAHPQTPSMAATALTLNGQKTIAAAPWAALPQSTLDRTMFLHHATNTVIHPDEVKVLQLSGGVNNHDNLLSMLATQLQPLLGCVQGAPIVLGASGSSEYIDYKGRPQPPLSPTALAAVLGNPTGPLSSLQAARDRDLDAINAWVKENGNAAQAALIDRFATSREQVRQLSDALIGQLSAISDDSIASQLTAAMVLAQMKLAPIFTVHMPFGGDNHGDANLTGEANAHVSSLGVLKNFVATMTAASMQDSITFASLNVFGRTLNAAQCANGRNHLGNHHVMVAIGKNIAGGVYGGVQPMEGDYGAMPIDSKTGQGSASGDINLTDSLPTAGKTLGAALGIDSTTLGNNIEGGVVLTPILKA